MDGRKDVLGMWVGENESAKFEDILIACTDNLTGFSQAIEAVFPKREIPANTSHTRISRHLWLT